MSKLFNIYGSPGKNTFIFNFTLSESQKNFYKVLKHHISYTYYSINILLPADGT